MNDFSTGKYKFSDFVKLVDGVISGKKKNVSRIDESFAVDEGMKESYDNVIDSLINSPNLIDKVGNPQVMRTHMNIFISNMMNVYGLLMNNDGDVDDIRKGIKKQLTDLEPESFSSSAGSSFLSSPSGMDEIEGIMRFAKEVSDSMVRNPESYPRMERVGEKFNDFLEVFKWGISRLVIMNNWENGSKYKSSSALPHFDSIEHGNFAAFDNELSKLGNVGKTGVGATVLTNLRPFVISKIKNAAREVLNQANRSGGVPALPGFWENAQLLFAFKTPEEAVEKAAVISTISPVAINRLRIDTSLTNLKERSSESGKPYINMMIYALTVADGALTTVDLSWDDIQNIKVFVFNVINDVIGEMNDDYDFNRDLEKINGLDVRAKIRGYKVLKLFVNALEQLNDRNVGIQSNREIDRYRTDGKVVDMITGNGKSSNEEGEEGEDEESGGLDDDIGISTDDLTKITGGDGKIYNQYLEGEDIQAIVDGINDDLAAVRSLGISKRDRFYDLGCTPRFCLSILSKLSINKLD